MRSGPASGPDAGDLEVSGDWSCVIDLQPRHGEAYRERCYDRMQKQIDAALDDLKWATEFNPRSARRTGERGIARWRTRTWADAVASLDRALKLDPKSVEALTTRAQAHLRKPPPGLAVADCTRAID